MGHDGAERLDAGEIREKRFRWLYPPTIQCFNETWVAAFLHPLLFLLAFTTAIMLGSTIFVSWIPVFQSFMLATIFCGFLGLHFFLRQGRVRLVSWSTVILVIASGITASILDPTDSVYPLPFIIGIALAGLTMGPRAPLFLASISALWLGLINFGQIAGWFVLDRPVELFEVIISQLFLVLLMGATMTVANIALKRAFEMVDSKEAAQRRLESNLALLDGWPGASHTISTIYSAS